MQVTVFLVSCNDSRPVAGRLGTVGCQSALPAGVLSTPTRCALGTLHSHPSIQPSFSSSAPSLLHSHRKPSCGFSVDSLPPQPLSLPPHSSASSLPFIRTAVATCGNNASNSSEPTVDAAVQCCCPVCCEHQHSIPAVCQPESCKKMLELEVPGSGLAGTPVEALLLNIFAEEELRHRWGQATAPG